MCFRALVGCFRPTTHSETLSKDPKSVFWFVRDKIGKIKENKCVHCADFAPNVVKTHSGGLCSEDVMQWSATSSPPEPESTLEASASKDATG